MAEETVVPAEKTTWGNLVWIAAPTVLFGLRTARWWYRWSTGAVLVDAMTGWDWFQVIFSHVAVVGGIVALASMILRERSRAPEV